MGLDLVIGTRPLSVGNASPEELRRDYLQLTPAERVQQAMELSDFLSGVAEAASHRIS